MSGYRNSGLTEEEFGDREVLRAAAEVIARRWPERADSGGVEDRTIFALSVLVEELEQGNDGL